ncbi:MAG: preprotein translocase subunit SecA, partial [Clostridia bacterium]|nr:preprotein translocase subunit SecA [Clostridia bacterium]
MGLFKSYSEKQIKKIVPIVDKIEALADTFRQMSDEEMRAYTDKLKAALRDGATLDDILPEAFALVREADERVLGKRPYRVQLMGGILLHQGRIAEMKTGEGKTLVATLPAYLNALTEKGVHIVTVNDYLATRDSEEMGRVYGFLGLTTGLIVHGQDNDEKRKAYAADITYGTNNELGFDYLRDNMVVYKENMVQRGHNFAIVDEVDSILIDEARTPLIISGQGSKSTELYTMADRCARMMSRHVIKEIDDKADNDALYDEDYIVDEKARTAVLTKHFIEKVEKFFNIENLSAPENNAILTPAGAAKAEEFFGIENYTAPENSSLAHHINQAIRAHGCMHKDIDYVVNDNGVMIVDAFTGRLMPGRRFNNGLHQAIEAKEHVKIEKENKTLASITFQNYFRMYKKLSGMTGTALTEETEFREIYGLDVIEIPTNRPMIRKDHPDSVYKNVKGKYDAVVKQIIECHENGQPVLVGTVSIEKSEELSRKLKANGIPHTVLNAKYHEKEAEIIAQAGKLGAVTISTNMAGRGTDIMLGGNPEYMAKNEMRKREIDEGLIAMATGTAQIDDEEVIAARAMFSELYEKFKAEIAPEADKVREAGGLFILGTERHESRRIDNQLRGRSGRQGDPGESRFYLSLEDDLMRLFGSERILGMVDSLGLDDDTPIDARILSNSIESAQKRIEDANFKRRKNVLTYDDVLNQQREVIYKQRREVLDGNDISATIKNMIIATISMAVENATMDENKANWNLSELCDKYKGLLCDENDFEYTAEELKKIDKIDIRDMLCDKAMEVYAEKEELFGAETLREIERAALLQTVDRNWMEHIDIMDELKHEIGLQAYAQRDPVNEYRLQGADIFDAMVEDIRETTVRIVLTVTPKAPEIKRVEVAKPIMEGFEGAAQKKTVVIKKSEKIGPNSPCPCGSGKKYK